MPSRAATSLMNAAISGRLRSKAAAGDRLREGRACTRVRQVAQGVRAFNYDPMSFRREYSAMRIPKPARSVTTELPP